MVFNHAILWIFVFSYAKSISWPDPNHFQVIVDPFSGSTILASWAIRKFATQHRILEAEFKVLRANDSRLHEIYQHLGISNFLYKFGFDQYEADLLIWARIKTLFNQKWTEVHQFIRTGGEFIFAVSMNLVVRFNQY